MAITNQSKPTAEYPIDTEDAVSLLCEDSEELVTEKSEQEITNINRPS